MKDFKNPQLYIEEKTLFEDAKRRYSSPEHLDANIKRNREYWEEQEMLKNRATADSIGQYTQYKPDEISQVRDLRNSSEINKLTREWSYDSHSNPNGIPITAMNSGQYLSQAEQILGVDKLDINKLADNKELQSLTMIYGIAGAATVLLSHFQLAGFAFGLPLMLAAAGLAYVKYTHKKAPANEQSDTEQSDDESPKESKEDEMRKMREAQRARRRQRREEYSKHDQQRDINTVSKGNDVEDILSSLGLGDDEDDAIEDTPVHTELASRDKERLPHDRESISRNYVNRSDKSLTFAEQYPDIVNSSNPDEFYDYAESFLQYVIANRKELSKLKTPKELWSLYGRMMPEFNTGFAKFDEIKEGSTEYYNIAYTLHKFISSVYRNYAKADEHNDAFILMINEIEQNDLFYKISLRVPLGASAAQFSGASGLLRELLKSNPQDEAIAINFATFGENLVIKLFKITQSGAKTFVPLVSTADVLRYDGIKDANTGKPLLDQLLSDKYSLATLMGLSEGEWGVTFDVALEKVITIIGKSGSGKSASALAMFLLMFILHNPEELVVFILDPKNASAWGNAKYFPHIQMLYADDESYKKSFLLPSFLGQVSNERQKQINENGWESITDARKDMRKNHEYEDGLYKAPHILAILDEQKSHFEKLQSMQMQVDRINQGLKRNEAHFADFWGKYDGGIAQSSVVIREGGITFAGISQANSYKADYSQNLLNATSAGIALKSANQSQFSRTLMRAENITSEDPTSFPTGYAYYNSEDQGSGQVTMPLAPGNPEMTRDLSRVLGYAMTILANERINLRKIHPSARFSEAYNNDLFQGDLRSTETDEFPIINRGERLDEVAEILRGDKPLFTDKKFEERRSLYWEMPVPPKETPQVEQSNDGNSISSDDNMEKYTKKIKLLKRLHTNSMPMDRAIELFGNPQVLVQLHNAGYIKVADDRKSIEVL